MRFTASGIKSTEDLNPEKPMPAATNKSDLIAVTEKEYAKLTKLLDTVDPDTATEKTNDTSIKDVVGHRAHWIDLFLGWYRDGQAGTQVHFPAEGYKWNELNRYNADLRARQADLGWDDAKALLDRNAKTLLQFIRDHSDDELYSGPMKGANNNWTTGRWAEAAGPSHYRSAAKYIRGILRRKA